VGDLVGPREGGAYVILGNAYQSQGDFSKAIEYHTKDLAKVGDRAGEGRVYGNLGNAYLSQGDFSKAIDVHAQCLAIAKEVGNRERAGRPGTLGVRISRRACGNIGNAYNSRVVGKVLPRISFGTWGLCDRLCLVLVCRGRYGLGGGFFSSFWDRVWAE
jgi:tetratricopeptide (TPR) repeat protein